MIAIGLVILMFSVYLIWLFWSPIKNIYVFLYTRTNEEMVGVFHRIIMLIVGGIILGLFVGVALLPTIDTAGNVRMTEYDYGMLFFTWAVIGIVAFGGLGYLLGFLITGRWKQATKIALRTVLFIIGLSVLGGFMLVSVVIAGFFAWEGGIEYATINPFNLILALCLPSIIFALGLHNLGMFLLTGRFGKLHIKSMKAFLIVALGLSLEICWYYAADGPFNHFMDMVLVTIIMVMFYIGATYWIRMYFVSDDNRTSILTSET